MLTKSIRWRIQAWHGLMLVALTGGLLTLFYGYVRNDRVRELDGELQAQMTMLMPVVGPPNSGGPMDGPMGGPPEGRDGPDGPGGQDGPGEFDDRRPLAQRGPREPEGPGGAERMREFDTSGRYYYVTWSEVGGVRRKSKFAPEIPAPTEAEKRIGRLLRTRGQFREVLQRLPRGQTLVVGAPLSALQSRLRPLAWELAGTGLAIVVCGLCIGWWLAGRALRPIAEISAAASEISAGDLSKRISTAETESELGQLALVLNQTFERLHASFEQQVRFTADASHELRTPISVMLTQIQLARSRPRDAEYYRQTLETCERAAVRMRTLVAALLELARADSGEIGLKLEPCDLARVARESLEFIAPLAGEKNARVREELSPVMVKADAAKLSQIFVNLLNNSLQHNANGVEISVSVRAEGGRAIARVADNGVGIPAEALPNLFERFFRVDKSRSRNTGNNGLGLAISKAIITAHGGTIRAESAPGRGIEFVIELPLAGDTVTEAR